MVTCKLLFHVSCPHWRERGFCTGSQACLVAVCEGVLGTAEEEGTEGTWTSRLSTPLLICWEPGFLASACQIMYCP